MYALKGKVAIVTGSGRHRGLGKAIALRLAEEGCHIVITDIGTSKGPQFPEDAIGTTTEMEDIANEVRALGVQAITQPCDVRHSDQVAQLVEATVSALGRVDILVANAGVGYIMQAITELPDRDWSAVLDVNLKGVYLCIQHVAKQLIAQGEGGRIINIASQAAKSAFPFAAAYTSSKHGLVGLTRTAAIELGPHNITVNAVCPNHITTGLGAWQNEFFREKFDMTLEQYMDGIRSRIPLGRIGEPEDIAKAVAFFASDQASFITGEALNVSGGEEMH